MKPVVVYGGKFQLVHKGHLDAYRQLTKKWGADAVFVCTAGKVEAGYPFSFPEKKRMMMALGIPGDRIVETVVPFKATELLATMQVDDVVLIQGMSDKPDPDSGMSDAKRLLPQGFDVAEPKNKSGNVSYYRPLPSGMGPNAPASIEGCLPASQAGYVDIIDVKNFLLLGQTINSARDIRTLFASSDDEKRKQIVTELYGQFSPEIYAIFCDKLLPKNEGYDRLLRYIKESIPSATPEMKSEYIRLLEEIKLSEMPIELNKDDPNNPMIYGTGANPATLNDRKSRALRQLKALQELAAMGQWDRVVTLFPEVQMNVEQVAHGMQELEAVRRKGGKNSRGITPT